MKKEQMEKLPNLRFKRALSLSFGSSNCVTAVVKIGNSQPMFYGPGYPIFQGNKWTGGRKYHNCLVTI